MLGPIKKYNYNSANEQKYKDQEKEDGSMIERVELKMTDLGVWELEQKWKANQNMMWKRMER